MTQVQDQPDVTSDTADTSQQTDANQAPEPQQDSTARPESTSQFQSMREKAAERLKKGAESSPHRREHERLQAEQDTGESDQAATDTASADQQQTTADAGSTTTSMDAADSPTEDSQKSDETTGQNADPNRLEKARQALKRSQWGDDQISALPEDEILKAGEKLQKREADREKQYQENQRIKKVLQDAGLDPDNLSESLQSLLGSSQSQTQSPASSDAPQSSDSTADASTSQQNGDIKSAVHSHIDQALGQLSSDELMGESANTLKQALTSSLDQVIDHYENRLSSLQADTPKPESGDESTHSQDANEIQQIRQQYETLAMDQTLIASGLDQEYDQLKDPETRNTVRSHAKRLVDSDTNGDLYYDESGNPQWHDALRHAAYIHLGAPASQQTPDPQQQKADLLDRQRQVHAAQPSPDRETNGQSTKQMSRIERMTMLAKARNEGRPEQDIQRLRQQLYGRSA